MGKKSKVKSNEPFYPLVSVCTPTFNRRPFIHNMFQCFLNQDYPKHRIEWIIVDDGTDKIKDLIETSNIPQIRYFQVENKMTLGAKRNYMHKFVRGSIVVYMDDDDYYPPDRISHAVERLLGSPTALCAGASELYIYFKHISKMFQCGPYGPNHATAGTFAFKAELLKQTKYEEHAAVAEERAFLKDYTIPFVQLDAMKSILVFSHEHNTFDKRKMLDAQHPDYFRESSKKVTDFIKGKHEKPIYDFFMLNIDKLLEKYEPGEPKMKPDVLKQIKEIEEKRAQMVKEEMEKQGNGHITIQRPGEEPIHLNNQQVLEIMTQQQQQLQVLTNRAGELETMVTNLQKQLIEKTKSSQLTNVELNKAKKRIAELEMSVSSKAELIEVFIEEMKKREKEKEVEMEMEKPVAIVEVEKEDNITISESLPEQVSQPEIIDDPPLPAPAPAPAPPAPSNQSKIAPEIIVDVDE